MIEISFEKRLKSAYGNILLQVDKTISKGEFISIYGKSGVGKTSTLRILAGLLQPEKGFIQSDGKVLLDTQNNISLPPQNRKIGMVFQNYSLFPNMTVFENLRFALHKNQSEKILDELIEIMEINGLKNQKPNKLSGGQQQRVAVARALVQNPEILLLDEPFSSLDSELRNKLQVYLSSIHKEFGLTTFLVSHDQAEVLKLSDRIWVMENGGITFDGNPLDYFSPNYFSKEFQTTGELIKIEKKDNENYALILIGKDIAKINATENELGKLKIGQKIILDSVDGKLKIRTTI